jgi:PAS domain-containing protein
MFLEFPNKNSKRYISLFLILSFAAMFIIMYLMQEIKHLIFPNITIMESHWITNIFSAFAAVIIARIGLQYLGKYHKRINDEIEDRERLEKERIEAISILDTALDSTVDGILIVNKDGKVEKSNKKFIELWDIPQSVMETKDDAILIEYVIDQLEDPEMFLEGVRTLYSNPQDESFDELHFKDGRIYERYSNHSL